MASARRTGTSEDVKTYKTSGGDYSVLATWEAATDNDNVTGTVSPVLECYPSTSAIGHNDTTTLDGATNNATYFRILRAASVKRHNGRRDTGVCFYSTADSDCIRIAESNSHVQDVCGRITINSASTRVVFRTVTAGSDARFVGCLATLGANTGAGTVRGFQADRVTGFVVCVSENNDGNGFHHGAAVAVFCYSCTAADNAANNFSAASTDLTVKNCLSYSAGTSDFAGSYNSSSDWNASSDATAPGSSSRLSQTFTFVDASLYDFRIDETDVGARSQGQSLESDATFAFDDDLERITWGPTWDIGAGKALRIATYAASTTFVVPGGVTSLARVECWAAGGNGANSTNDLNTAGGGGGGGYAQIRSLAVTPAASHTVTVGAVGSDTWFSATSTVRATSGSVGVMGTPGSGGAGGTGAVGDLLADGATGGNPGGGLSGVGGAGAYGGGAGGTAVATGNNGIAGTAPGGGGSGAYGTPSQGYTGGAGGAGRVVVRYVPAVFTYRRKWEPDRLRRL